jgi:predicted MPP superfamily phosphohydrolase
MRFSSAGRGRAYHPLRGLIESSLGAIYHGNWPARLWELWPRSCEVDCIRLRVPILDPGAAPLRVGFASDLHIGPTTPDKLLDNAFEQLAREQLDLLLLGGDYIFLDATPAKAARLAQLVERVPARRKFAVMGNHDLWAEHTLLEDALERAGAEVLHNAHVVLGSGPGALTVIGLDEPWTGSIDAAAALEGVSGAHALLVLCHSPDGLPAALSAVSALANVPRGLFVCGHTHGGQIAAPWGPLLIPGRVGKRYPHGFHHAPPLFLHVSRGVGATELPMRTYARPDIAVFELVASEA